MLPFRQVHISIYILVCNIFVQAHNFGLQLHLKIVPNYFAFKISLKNRQSVKHHVIAMTLTVWVEEVHAQITKNKEAHSVPLSFTLQQSLKLKSKKNV